jgi:hypothetical protein
MVGVSWSVRIAKVPENSMKKRNIGAVVLGLFLVAAAIAQPKKLQPQRRPARTPAVPLTSPQPVPDYEYSSILDGTPKGLYLHHDTEVGTGNPIDVYMFAIELQVLNSDGDLEPEGLIIDNFYTAKPQQPLEAPNPYNAHDCRIWSGLVLDEIKNQPLQSPTWSYVEFTVAQGARVVQTNEDGQVWWSDDIECWGSRDRFPPF